jgi:NADP-dependent 3-hydroxy acid dehydrogenase YdfG
MTRENTLAVIFGVDAKNDLKEAHDTLRNYNKVLLVGDDRKALHKRVLEIERDFPKEKAIYVQADLTKEDELAKLICLVKHKFGGADHVLNYTDIEGFNQKTLVEGAFEKFHAEAVNG